MTRSLSTQRAARRAHARDTWRAVVADAYSSLPPLVEAWHASPTTEHAAVIARELRSLMVREAALSAPVLARVPLSLLFVLADVHMQHVPRAAAAFAQVPPWSAHAARWLAEVVAALATEGLPFMLALVYLDAEIERIARTCTGFDLSGDKRKRYTVLRMLDGDALASFDRRRACTRTTHTVDHGAELAALQRAKRSRVRKKPARPPMTPRFRA